MLHTAFNLLLKKDRDLQLTEKNHETITHLKFIGTFQPNEKINIRNMTIENQTVITPLLRLFYGESREKTHTFLRNTIDRSFEIVNSIMYSEKLTDKSTVKNIIKDLMKAITGIKNIQKTYRDDKLFVCNMENMIEQISAKVYEIHQIKPDLIDLEDFVNSVTSESPSVSPLNTYIQSQDVPELSLHSKHISMVGTLNQDKSTTVRDVPVDRTTEPGKKTKEKN
jgi:hypothetical protein